ncbi:MAG: GNAT family protein, partial [Solirubrobacteraceae bacterium]
DELAARCGAAILQRGWGLWAVEVVDGPDAGRFAGFTGLAIPGFATPFGEAVEVGWRLARWAWGRGYATEAAHAAVAFGFDDAGLEEIVSFTAEQNLRSRAVMERLGMTHDPADDFDHPLVDEATGLRRHVLYRLRANHGR